MTVFLTTQYLEEADVLADRVGIIDHGRIVAEGTPAELKAQIGSSTLEAVPADPGQRERVAEVLAGFGEPVASSPKGVSVRLREGAEQLGDIVRALDSADLRVSHLQVHSPSLDDVFLAKTGRTLEGAAAAEEGVAARAGARLMRAALVEVGFIAAALAAPHAAPAVPDRALDRLPADPARRELRRPAPTPTACRGSRPTPTWTSRWRLRSCRPRCSPRSTRARRWPPTSSPASSTGSPLTPLRGIAVLVGQLAGAAVLGLISAVTFIAVALVAGASIETGVAGALVLVILALLVAAVFSGARRVLRSAHRVGPGGAGDVPAPLRDALPVLGVPPPPAHRGRLVPRPSPPTTRCPTSSRRCAAWSSIGWDGTALLRGAAVLAVLGALAFAGAARALQTRMERT